MKNLTLLLLAFCVSCSNANRTDTDTSKFSTSAEKQQNSSASVWLTTSEHLSFSGSFEDSCLTIRLEVVSLNSIDSTLNLVNKCEGQTIGILAARYRYPDGRFSMRSLIANDTILTVSIGEYMGDYFEGEYYEQIIDSVTTKRVLTSGKLSQVLRDSIRTTKRIEL